jgi:hypothetical protein
MAENVRSKRNARSGKVGYATPIVLSSSSSRIIQLIPIYIRHNTKPEGLTLKLVQSRVETASYLSSIDPEVEINLSEEASRRLLEVVPELAELSGYAIGDYLVLGIDGSLNVDKVGAQRAATALIAALSSPGIRDRISIQDLDSELIDGLQGLVRLRQLQEAVAELEKLLTSDDDEHHYQEWCRRHSWAFGTAYQEADPVRLIAVGDQVDFLLPIMSGYRDIVELKRPGARVISWDAGHRDFYFSQDVSQAIGQCNRYMEQAESGLDLRDNPETASYTYHPRATIVIGRSHGWERSEKDALRSLNTRLNGITVMTYDELLAQAGRLLQIVEDEASSGEP